MTATAIQLAHEIPCVTLHYHPEDSTRLSLTLFRVYCLLIETANQQQIEIGMTEEELQHKILTRMNTSVPLLEIIAVLTYMSENECVQKMNDTGRWAVSIYGKVLFEELNS
jgi:hypothetical protein